MDEIEILKKARADVVVGCTIVFIASCLVTIVFIYCMTTEYRTPKPSNITALITYDYTPYCCKDDKHEITGFIINLGEQTTQNIQITITWNITDIEHIVKTINISSLEPYEIKQITQTYYFNTNGTKLPYTYKIEWTELD